MKGMKIAMAEMGLIDYFGGVPRTKDIFADIGDKVLRKNMLLLAWLLYELFSVCPAFQKSLYIEGCQAR